MGKQPSHRGRGPGPAIAIGRPSTSPGAPSAPQARRGRPTQALRPGASAGRDRSV